MKMNWHKAEQQQGPVVVERGGVMERVPLINTVALTLCATGYTMGLSM